MIDGASVSVNMAILAQVVRWPYRVTMESISGVGGNWTNNGAFTHNNRQVKFNGASQQTIGGASISCSLTCFLRYVIVPACTQPCWYVDLQRDPPADRDGRIEHDFLKIARRRCASYNGVNIADGSWRWQNDRFSSAATGFASVTNGLHDRDCPCCVISPATAASAEMTALLTAMPSCKHSGPQAQAWHYNAVLVANRNFN